MASTEPQSELQYGWSLGESGWNDEMDTNLKRVGRLAFHLSVIDRDLTAPPGGESAGDTYIVNSPATGDWEGQEDKIAYYDGSDWVFYIPRDGYQAWIEDEDKMSVFKTGSSYGWSDGVAHSWS